MVKLIGAVMAGASCGYFGLRMRFNMRARQTSLQDIVHSLELLETEIGFGQSRLKNALMRADRNGLFKAAAENVEEMGALGAWEYAIDSLRGSLCLTDADCEALIQLGTNMGRTDTEGEIKNIRYVKSLISAQLTAAKEDYKRLAPLCSGGGVLIGALIVIILM